MNDHVKELDQLLEKTGANIPNRDHMSDPDIVWRNGKPNYTLANIQYIKGKSMKHSNDSLEKVVEDLVKTWEMEITHKTDVQQWETVDLQNFSLSTNGGRIYKADEVTKLGSYYTLLSQCPKELFDAEKENFETSHDLFRSTFTQGFAWEVIRVFSGPPLVTFSWRHWGVFDGKYKEREGDNEIYELYGFCTSRVNEQLKIQDVNVYFKPEEFLQVLQGDKSRDILRNGFPIVGPGCPIYK